MASDVAEAALSVRAALEQKDRDPLRYWKWGVSRLREAFALFSADEPISELHLRACNKGGKTLSKAAFVLACLQKRHELDGVPIPQWRGPIEALQLVLDYPQQLLSVKPAYLKVLGSWPARVVPNGEYLSAIHVMPMGGNPHNEADWSVIHFLSQKNADSGRGARTDLIDFDEPPKMDFLDELRKAGHSGRRSIRIIGETPLKRREWAPLRQDYGDCPRASIRRVDRYRAECRWSLSEVADWILSPAEKRELVASWARSAHAMAREHGDYESTEGRCPFDEATIMKMIDHWCRDPDIIKHLSVSCEDQSGKPGGHDRVPVQIWGMPKHGRTYYQDIDPASGIDDDKHNPLGLHLSDDDTGELLVRWNGYKPPFTVGYMAAVLHRHYHGAATDIEMKDHWGVNVVRGYEYGNGTNLCHEQRLLSPGVWGKEVGWDANRESRADGIGCVQQWIEAFRVGNPYAPCYSAEVFNCLLDMELDDRDLPVAGPGIAHAEDCILLERKLVRLGRHTPDVPEVYVPQLSENQRIAAMIRGEDMDEREPDVLEPRGERPRW